MQSINVTPGVPHTLATGGAVTTFLEMETWERNFTISGVTKNTSGAALGNCTVKLFNKATDVLAQTTTSDGSGNYSFTVDKTQTWYIIAYLPGSPDVAGTTLNTLAGV